jgi:hypothetical protein
MSQTRASRLKGLSFEPSALRSRPELAIRLVVIVNEWSVVEGIAPAVLASLLPGSGEPENYKQRLDVAAVMLGRVHSFRLRLDIIRAVARARLNSHPFDKALLNTLNELLDFPAKAEGERNKIAHKVFGTCDNYPDALIGVDFDIFTTSWQITLPPSPLLEIDYDCTILSRAYLQEVEERMVEAQRKMMMASLTLPMHEVTMQAVRRDGAPHGPSGAGSGPRTAK